MARKELLYGILQTLSLLILANADSHETFVNNYCVEFHLARVQEYDSTLETTHLPQNYSTHSEDDSLNLSLFGASPSDWTRLNLLRDALPEDSAIRKKFNSIFTILLVAHDQASKSNGPSHSQEVVNNFTRGKLSFIEDKVNSTTVKKLGGSSSFDYEIENTTLQSILEDGSNFENLSVMTETSFSAPKINKSFVKSQSDGPVIVTVSDESTTGNSTTTNILRAPLNFTSSSASISSSKIIEKNRHSSSEKARPILELTSYDSSTEIPFVEKNEFEGFTTPQHSISSNEQLSKSLKIRNETLCKCPSGAENSVDSFTNNRSGSISREKVDTLNIPENQNNHSLQSTISINLQTTSSTPKKNIAAETLVDFATTQSHSFVTESKNEFSISRKKEDEKLAKQFSEQYFSPSTITNNPKSTNVFLALTRNREFSWPTEQEIGTSSWTELSTETEEYSSAKILTSASSTPISVTIPSQKLSTNKEAVTKYPWALYSIPEEYSSGTKLKNDSKTAIESLMTTPTALVLTSGREEIEKILHAQNSKLENRDPTKATVVNFTTNVDLLSKTSLKDEQFLTTEDKTEKSNNTGFLTKFKIDPKFLKESSSNATKTVSTLGANGRYMDDLNSRTQESSSVSISEQTKSSENSWTTIFPSEKASGVIDTGNASDEIKTTNYRDQMEIFHIEKSISSKSDFLTDTSDVSTTSKNIIDDIEPTDYWNKIEIPEEVMLFSSTPQEPETDNPMNNSTQLGHSPVMETSIKKSEAISRPLQYVNRTGSENDKSFNEFYTTELSKETEDSVTVTAVPDETFSHSKPQETSTQLPKQNFVKNALRPSLSRTNQIARDYKHGINDSEANRNSSDHRPSDVYEFGVSAKNRKFWRQQLDKQTLTTNNIRRLKTIDENVKPINLERNNYEKSSNNRESNVPVIENPNNSFKCPTHGRVNKLRPRKRDSENRDIEQRFRRFYRQGQTEDRSKSRLKENDYSKLKVRCKNPQH